MRIEDDCGAAVGALQPTRQLVRCDHFALPCLLPLAAHHALADLGLLELGDGTADGEEEPALRRGVDLLGDELQADARPLELIGQDQQVGEAAGEAVGVEAEDDIGAAVADGLAHLLQGGAVEVAAGIAVIAEGVVVAVADDRITAIRRPLSQPDDLGFEPVLLGLGFAADPRVQERPWS